MCHLQSGKKHQFEMGFATAVLIHCIENETSNILWKCCCYCCCCCYRGGSGCCCCKWITTCNSIEPAQLSIDTYAYKSIVCSARIHSFFCCSIHMYNLYLCVSLHWLLSFFIPYEKKGEYSIHMQYDTIIIFSFNILYLYKNKYIFPLVYSTAATLEFLFALWSSFLMLFIHCFNLNSCWEEEKRKWEKNSTQM